MDRLLSLDTDNATAWALYQRLCNRFVNDIQAGSVVLDRLTADDDAESFGDKVERLNVIYAVLQPPKAQT